MKPRLTLVGDGTSENPYTSVDEATAAASAAWATARRAHLRLLSLVAGPGMLRLHNGGTLPSQDRGREIDVYTMSGLAGDLRKVAAEAEQAAAALEEGAQALRSRKN